MNRVLDVRRPGRRRRSSDGRAAAVSVLRWPSGASTDGVFEMFSAHEAGRFASVEPEAPGSPSGENVLLVSASRRTAPDAPAVLLSLVNTSPFQAVKLSVKLAGRRPTSLVGTILTAPLLALRKDAGRQRPAQSHSVAPSAFQGAVLKGKVVEVTVPARSVVVLTVQ
jgi:alpha-N-arabinofuranosidase